MKIIRCNTSGVTLIEITLVLSIIGLILVSSIKFYKTASARSQVLAILEDLQVIAGIADSYAVMSGYANFSTSSLPDHLQNSQWGHVTISDTTISGYSVTFESVPQSVCGSISPMLTHTKFTTNNDCSSSGAMTFIYNNA